MPATTNQGTAFPAKKRSQPEPLHWLHQQGGLSDDEFVFCRILLYLPDTPLSDRTLAGVVGRTVPEVRKQRKALKGRGLLTYEFNPKDGRFLYQPCLYNEYAVAREMLASLQTPEAPPRHRRTKSKPPQEPRARWIVREQGQRAHLLRRTCATCSYPPRARSPTSFSASSWPKSWTSPAPASTTR